MLCLEDDIIDMVSMTQCTCGADGRAHKDCPMNLRHCYPGRTLFPPPGSDVETSPLPDGGLEPPGDDAAPRERGKALPAKKKVEKMKVGDYVWISLRSLACDAAVTEHCDCSLPEKSEYTIILSSSEMHVLTM